MIHTALKGSRFGWLIPAIMLVQSVVGVSAQEKPVESAKTEKPAEAEKSADVKLARPATDFLILPLRVYRLKSQDLPEVDCRELTDADLRRIIGKVNIVWAAAGIYWNLDSIEDVAAENAGRLKLTGIVDDDAVAEAEKKSPAKKPHTLFRGIIPAETRRNYPGFRVYYIHDFDVNGVYFGRREAVVKETAALRPVNGGINEPLPRVTSHELGHALGLPHRQDRFNLLASGTSGTLFNTEEISITRENALKNPACLTMEKLRQEADKSTDNTAKKRLSETIRNIEAIAAQPVHPAGSAYDSFLDRLKSEPAK